ncbi:hypothetical protein [Cohnella lupini]|uniref:Uncharacterized protein n=1 Tax=Cohnella lupini TaxID=1294267 RepID=A0A3D9HQ70_9BACL|nr:hypothetical protein [Cohnella lupini]RED51653.1 hypothetical protein DFP95_14228 [Cohnella lupini]
MKKIIISALSGAITFAVVWTLINYLRDKHLDYSGVIAGLFWLIVYLPLSINRYKKKIAHH